MKQVLRSLRLFTAQYTITSLLQVLAIVGGAYLFIGIMSFGALNVLEESPDSFLAGFFTSFLPGMTIMVPLMGVFLLNAMYSYNMPTTPGYKYLHSISDSEKHFRRAIIGSNIAAVLMGLLAVLVTWLMCKWVGELFLSPIATLAISFAGIGIVNFTGFIKGQFARLISIMPMCAVVGFMVGFTSVSEEGEEAIFDEKIMYIVLVVAAAVAVAGFIFSMIKCEKKWRADK